MSEFMTITKAAVRLTEGGEKIDRSTLSRYLKQHAEAGLVTADGLVDFNRLLEHRGENIRLRSRAPSTPRAPAASQAQTPGARFAQNDAAARDRMAVAEMREMDLAERRKELTPVSEVDASGRDAVALMMSAFERAIETEAATLSLKYGWDERTVRLALKGFSRQGLENFNREVLRRLDAMRRDADAGLPVSDLEQEGAALQ
ncbi:hypothetical protein [Shinella sp.]|jgi:DNA-binding transcriptional ArsR family regulator|uniref:hypothetical protein n=1 Tax=Shinella sp. TaxID=1870904 RepID=UPI003F6F1B48